MTFEQIVQHMRDTARRWRDQEIAAIRAGRQQEAHDCRVRARALDYEIEALEQEQAAA